MRTAPTVSDMAVLHGRSTHNPRMRNAGRRRQTATKESPHTRQRVFRYRAEVTGGSGVLVGRRFLYDKQMTKVFI